MYEMEVCLACASMAANPVMPLGQGQARYNTCEHNMHGPDHVHKTTYAIRVCT